VTHLRHTAPGPWLVLGRAVVLGSVGLGSAVVSHVIGGGRLPSTAALLGLLAVAVVLSSFWLRRWTSARTIVPVVVAAQAAGHLALSLLAGHAGDPRVVPAAAASATPDLGTGRRTGSLHDAYLASLPGAAPSDGGGSGLIDHQIAHLAEQGPAMFVAHVAGAVVLGLFLARGEAAIRGLVSLVADAVGAVLHAGLALPAVGSRLRLDAPSRRCCVAAGRLSRDTVRHRGPPRLLVA
jgi:hypothetical protein